MEARSEGVGLARVTVGPIQLPTVDLAVDVDCEHKDGAVYLWGATVTEPDGPDGAYTVFANWDADFDSDNEKDLAHEFIEWLSRIIDRAEAVGQTVGVFHYGPTEPGNLQRILADDQRARCLSDQMVDLLAVVRDHFDGVDGKSLKAVGASFGARWRSGGATGADTTTWVDSVRGRGADAPEIQAKLIAYNQDDTKALRSLREGLSKV